MKNIEYQLRSNPKMFVTVPAKFATKAVELLNIIKIGLSALHRAGIDYDYLGRPGIYGFIEKLAILADEDPSLPIIEDLVFLWVCRYGTPTEIREERNTETGKLNKSISEVLSSYSRSV